MSLFTSKERWERCGGARFCCRSCLDVVQLGSQAGHLRAGLGCRPDSETRISEHLESRFPLLPCQPLDDVEEDPDTQAQAAGSLLSASSLRPTPLSRRRRGRQHGSTEEGSCSVQSLGVLVSVATASDSWRRIVGSPAQRPSSFRHRGSQHKTPKSESRSHRACLLAGRLGKGKRSHRSRALALSLPLLWVSPRRPLPSKPHPPAGTGSSSEKPLK